MTNAFAAYYLVLTMMLAGRLNNATEAVAFFRELIRVQVKDGKTTVLSRRV